MIFYEICLAKNHLMKKIIPLFFLFALAVACQQTPEAKSPEQLASPKSIYYWKTQFELNDYELDFLKKHDISRIYVRMFDVVENNEFAGDTLALIPNATIRFISAVPEGIEIVPTVYITYDAIMRMGTLEEKELGSYANRILTRIDAMVSYNNLPAIKEVQFDCDWTNTYTWTYSRLCKHVKDILNKRGMQFSITLRLHQMADSILPPADRGVLMLYNTGAFKNPDTVNSILTYNDAEPYIRKHNVPFPVDYAYPTYEWNLLYRNGEFKQIIRDIDLNDCSLFVASDYNKYVVQKDTAIGKSSLKVGDVIRHETSDFNEIEKVKSDLSRHHDMKDSRQIIYHLDSTNLSKYTDDEIEYILLSY